MCTLLLFASAHIYTLSLFYTSHSCTKHIKFLPLLPLPPFSDSPSFSLSVQPCCGVWLIGDTWDECETWELCSSSEHQPPCRASVLSCTVKKKKRTQKKRSGTEVKRGTIVIYGGSRLRVFRLCPDGGISFRRTWISEYGHQAKNHSWFTDLEHEDRGELVWCIFFYAV